MTRALVVVFAQAALGGLHDSFSRVTLRALVGFAIANHAQARAAVHGLVDDVLPIIAWINAGAKRIFQRVNNRFAHEQGHGVIDKHVGKNDVHACFPRHWHHCCCRCLHALKRLAIGIRQDTCTERARRNCSECSLQFVCFGAVLGLVPRRAHNCVKQRVVCCFGHKKGTHCCKHRTNKLFDLRCAQRFWLHAVKVTKVAVKRSAQLCHVARVSLLQRGSNSSVPLGDVLPFHACFARIQEHVRWRKVCVL